VIVQFEAKRERQRTAQRIECAKLLHEAVVLLSRGATTHREDVEAAAELVHSAVGKLERLSSALLLDASEDGR
jgi:hypothetical protein